MNLGFGTNPATFATLFVGDWFTLSASCERFIPTSPYTDLALYITVTKQAWAGTGLGGLIPIDINTRTFVTYLNTPAFEERSFPLWSMDGTRAAQIDLYFTPYTYPECYVGGSVQSN